MKSIANRVKYYKKGIGVGSLGPRGLRTFVGVVLWSSFPSVCSIRIDQSPMEATSQEIIDARNRMKAKFGNAVRILEMG